MSDEYKEKRIGLISGMRVGLGDRGGFAVTFAVMFGESTGCSLGIYNEEATAAIIEAGYENIMSCRACYCVSLEKDGSWGPSCLVGFAGFVKANSAQ